MIIRTLIAGTLAVALTGLSTAPGIGADLPKATQDIMAKNKLPDDVLSGLDAELKMPQKWIDGAKKEGLVIVSGTWDADQFANLIKPFQERYPFLKFKYARATRHDRVIKPLLAYKA